jgi:heptosyltransferase-2
VLVIKLDAVGDVLRSTSILPKIKARRPDSYLCWVTRRASAPLLKENPMVDEVWLYDDTETINRLAVEAWDVVYNLDNGFPSSALAARVNGREKVGFTLSAQGVIEPTNEAAERWLEMACFDRCKKENRRSYQEIMYEICGFSGPICRPVLHWADADKSAADHALDDLWHEKSGGPLIGINTGSGARWPLKMLSEERIADLIRALHRLHPDWRILLLGGPNEEAKNARLMEQVDGTFTRAASCRHTLLEFGALVERCDLLICGDTLALHMATALRVPCVALFCPTSADEIYDYDGDVHKVRTEDCECYCSYNAVCPHGKDCINRIPLERICSEGEDALSGKNAPG